MNEELLNKIRLAVQEAFRGTPIFLAYAFGSRAEGSPTPQSDLDIGYYMQREERLPVKEEMVLAARLTTRTGMSVDLRNLRAAPLELRGRVLEEGVRIYCSDEVRRVNLERTTLGMYHDYKEEMSRMHDLRLHQTAIQGFQHR